MSSTKHPCLEEIDALSQEYKKIDNLQRFDFEFKYDVVVLGPSGKQRFTDLRPFDGSEDLTQIEDLQLHILHRRFYGIHPTALYEILRPMALSDWLPGYVSKCKEELKVVLEALARAKSIKGRLGLKKLTVVDKVPYKRKGRRSALHENTKKELKGLLADAYWPVLTQAAATLEISIENVKITVDYFPVFGLFATYQAQ